jgi:chromate transporter
MKKAASTHTFLPCFFFIFTGALFIEDMAGNRQLQAELTGVRAAMVGVVLNLAVWFGHKVILPDGGIALFVLLSAGVSLVLLQKFHLPVHCLVSLAAASGVFWRLFVKPTKDEGEKRMADRFTANRFIIYTRMTR